MPRRIVIVAIAFGLSGCALLHLPFHHKAHVAQLSPPVGAPRPPPALAQGLWAILDPGCPKPSAVNIRKWPSCASPFWISRGKAMMIRTSARGSAGHSDSSFSADYRLAGDDPVIAQVGNERDGYLFLALTHLSTDDQGQLVGAVGAAIACSASPQGGRIKPNSNGCDSQPPEAVLRAAELALQDRASLNQVAWIAPGAP